MRLSLEHSPFTAFVCHFTQPDPSLGELLHLCHSALDVARRRRGVKSKAHTLFRHQQVECTSLQASRGRFSRGPLLSLEMEQYQKARALIVYSQLGAVAARVGKGAAEVNWENRASAYLVGLEGISVIHLCKHSYNSGRSAATFCLVFHCVESVNE